ncbi:hypothetical protein RKD30_006791 [Streptomyces pristinaespiralis]
MLALYTDGLVESPGVDLDDSVVRLARCLDRADDRDLDLVIDTLLKEVRPTGQNADDIALLLLQAGGHEGR